MDTFVVEHLMRSMPLNTRANIDNAKCSVPGCTHGDHPAGELWLHARCHPAAGLSAVYLRGKLLIICAECEAPVVLVEVK